MSSEIVISGMSGRFPDADNLAEFQKKLFGGVSMVREDDTRWPKGYLGTYPTMGVVNTLKKFDAQFFNAHPKLATRMDPIVRTLLETTCEAFFDAGICPTEMRGSETAVIVGVSSNEAADWWSADPEIANGYEFLGCTRTMYSNRISFAFDLKGPSYTMDSQSSSGLVGIQQGYQMLQNGSVDAVVVGAVNLVLNPHFNIMFQKLNMLSPDGICKAFDANANGYARSDSGVVVVMQRASDARRAYATVSAAATNCTGFREEGCNATAKSGHIQLYKEVYDKSGIDPLNVTYFEAHGYCNVTEDAEELNGITDVFCKGRNTSLAIGTVKSNAGHAEPAGGLVALVKALLTIELGVVPPNLHFDKPNPNVPALVDGRLRVVTKLEPWREGYIAINSFGIGGTNSHLVLKRASEEKKCQKQIGIPRLILASGRNERCLSSYLKNIDSLTLDNEFCGLIYKMFSKNINQYNSKGFSISTNDKSLEPIIETQAFNHTIKDRPVCFIYSGMGSQWNGMARDLLQLDSFKKSFDKCASVLKGEDFDLYALINNNDECVYDDVSNSFVGITSVQVALTDVLREVGIQPDIIIGHSLGELGCAYADGTLTLEQTILATYWRAKALKNSSLEPGSMAAIGLSFDQMKARVPSDVTIACHNSKDNVTISGPPQSVAKLVSLLQSQNIFARQVNSSGLAFHSKLIAPAGKLFQEMLGKVITRPVMRTSRWISTSVPESKWNTDAAKYSSVQYHLNNLLSPVLFEEALHSIPENSVVIEIAPHALLQSILKSGTPSSCTHIGLVRRNHSSVTDLFTSIGRMFNAGLFPLVENLYPKVEFPVSRNTPMLQSLVEWDHSDEWFLISFMERLPSIHGETEFMVDFATDRYDFFMDRVINGDHVFPTSGYLYFIWKAIATTMKMNQLLIPVVIENFQIIEPQKYSRETSMNLEITILEQSGECEIKANGTLAARCRVRISDHMEEEFCKLRENSPPSQFLPMETDHVYQNLRAKGHNYNGMFRGIKYANNRGDQGRILWNDNWIAFLDTLLQLPILQMDDNRVHDVLHIGKISLDPKLHMEVVSSVTEEMGLPFDSNRVYQVIKCGGIEIRNALVTPLICTPASVTQIIRRYSFVPNIQPEEIMSYNDTIDVCVQLVCENMSVDKMKIVETITSSKFQPMTPIVENSMKFQRPAADYVIYVADASVDDCLKKYSIKNQNKDEMEKHCNLIITTNAIPNNLEKLFDCLDVDGFILNFEPTNDRETKESIDTLYRKMISKYRTTEGTFYLIRKVSDFRSVNIAKVTNKEYSWLEIIQMGLLRYAASKKNRPVLLFQENEPTGVMGLAKCVKLESYSDEVRCVLTDKEEPLYDYLQTPPYVALFRQRLNYNVRQKDKWGTYRYLPITDDVTMETEHAVLEPQQWGNSASMAFVESRIPHIKLADYPELELCHIYYCSVYIGDVKFINGQIVYPDQALVITKEEYACGSEFSGRTASGRRVFGVLPKGGGLGTTVLASKQLLWDVPDHWTLEDASTVPRSYATAYYILLVRGGLKAGESVYINEGASGLCVATINVALSLNANVLVGYRSPSELEYHRNTFQQIPVKNFIYTTGANMEYQILAATDGKGVDLIVDTMGSNNREQFLDALAPYGRLVEFEKMSRFNESLGTAGRQKNIVLHKVSNQMLWSGGKDGEEDRKQMSLLMQKGLKNGAIKPLNANTFPLEKLEDAFSLVKTYRYIGKVVVKIRDEENSKNVKPAVWKVSAIPRCFMDPESSVIVTGGLTEFGIQLIEWIITRGATKIVVSSKGGVQNGYQSSVLRKWKETHDVTVVVLDIDPSEIEAARNLVKLASVIGPVVAIFHATHTSGSSCLVEKLKLESFEADWQNNAATMMNMDVASRKTCPRLKYFVGFSFASGYGQKGHSTIAYASAALETLAERRHAENLPATVIQWNLVRHGGEIYKEGTSLMPADTIALIKMLPKLLLQPYPVVSVTTIEEGKSNEKSSNDTIAENLMKKLGNVFGIKKEEECVDLRKYEIEPQAMERVKNLLSSYGVNLLESEIRNLSLPTNEITALIS